MSPVIYDESKNMESRTALVVGIAVAFAAASTIVMVLRFYTRFVISKVAGWDDWTMLLAQILSVAVSVLKCAGKLHNEFQMSIRGTHCKKRSPFWPGPPYLDGVRCR